MLGYRSDNVGLALVYLLSGAVLLHHLTVMTQLASCTFYARWPSLHSLTCLQHNLHINGDRENEGGKGKGSICIYTMDALCHYFHEWD